MPDTTSPATLLLHPDVARGEGPRGLAATLERSSTFTLGAEGIDAMVRGEGVHRHDIYGRFGTATTREAARLVARLEGGEAALLTASGMAAISTVLSTLVPAGGRLACSDVVYGGTEGALRHAADDRGVAVERFDARDPASLDALLARGAPDLVWCESIANPLMRVSKVAELARRCQAAGAPLAVDATFAGGMAQHPLALGARVVVHSATKYLNGHSDVIAGVIVADGETVERCFRTLSRTGCCIDPQAAWLLQRGLRTLPLRWARQCANAAVLAPRLREHPAVAAVHWPGFDPDALAAAPLTEAGAMLAFEVADGAAADRLLASVRLCTHAVSLGGLETLVCSPRQTSHTQFDPQTRRARGIADGLVRVSVGIEDPDELWADLEQALGGLGAA